MRAVSAPARRPRVLDRTYGTIQESPKYWVIDTEPHVVLRLKRLFPRISKKQHGRISIAKNLETAREIEWFLQRYPMEFKRPRARQRLVSMAREHQEQETLVSELLSGARPPRQFDMALPPRDYQRLAAEMALATGGLLVTDDMGLGKTAIGICALTDPKTRPALVVTLTQLPLQWQREIVKFAPGMTTHIIKQSTPYKFDLPDVTICSYSKLSGWAETLAPVMRGVIWDEVQELRRGDASQKGAAAYHIAQHASFRCGLTATPVYNYGGEMWPVMQAIRPGALGTWAEFSAEWCGYEGADPKKARIQDPRSFGAYLRETCMMLRRTRKDVGRELPPIIRVPHYIDCDERKLDDIKSAAGELARIILHQRESSRGERFHASEQLSNLVRQATGIAKAPYAAEFIRLLAQSGEQIVVYAWHREVHRILQDRLQSLNPVFITGTESPAQKERSRLAFMSGASRILIMSLRAGAGLDGLQEVCKTLVFAELDWSSGVHEQCEGRIQRDEQKENVLAYYLLSEEGSDPIVADVLGIKREQLGGIRDPDAEMFYKLENDGGHIQKLAESYLRR